MGRARPGTELQLVGDPEDERRRSSGCMSCQGPACACMSPRGAKTRDSYGLKRSSSGMEPQHFRALVGCCEG